MFHLCYFFSYSFLCPLSCASRLLVSCTCKIYRLIVRSLTMNDRNVSAIICSFFFKKAKKLVLKGTKNSPHFPRASCSFSSTHSSFSLLFITFLSSMEDLRCQQVLQSKGKKNNKKVRRIGQNFITILFSRRDNSFEVKFWEVKPSIIIA